jgi:hypothetical protein
MISIFLEPLTIKHIGKVMAETKQCFLLFGMGHAGRGGGIGRNLRPAGIFDAGDRARDRHFG